MPRGVYDRSKMKKKTTEAKGDSAPAPKKYGKRQAKALAHPAAQEAVGSIGGGNRFYELQTAINTLTNTRQHANAPSINGVLDPLLTKAVSEYGELLFPKTEEVVAQKNGATAPVPAPVAAPVPFNAPTFAPAQS